MLDELKLNYMYEHDQSPDELKIKLEPKKVNISCIYTEAHQGDHLEKPMPQCSRRFFFDCTSE
uniref:Uncharacterized protein n=1 Tax=Setaria viridis TaxID=4556 RepID=A0A4U6THZ4_SETVI|nr:hypothetical protein SEVIR_8G132100v2 [Setaria viridis]